jgi:hypothetical protein
MSQPVCQLGRTHDPRGKVRGDPGAWAWPLKGRAGARDIIQVETAAVVRDALLRPKFLDDLQDLEKARQTLVRRHLEGSELKISPTQSRRQNEAAATDDVECG